MTFSAAHDSLKIADPPHRRRPSPGVGLALGAVVSLGLWALLIVIVLRLIG